MYSSTARRGTLLVVCLATAMLMLDQGGMALGVAAFGALVPAAATLAHGSAGGYVAGLHQALLIGAGVALAGALITAVLIGRPVLRRRPEPRLAAAEAAAEAV